MKINDKRKEPSPLKFGVLNIGTTFMWGDKLLIKIYGASGVYLASGTTASFDHDDLCMVVKCEVNIVE